GGAGQRPPTAMRRHSTREGAAASLTGSRVRLLRDDTGVREDPGERTGRNGDGPAQAECLRQAPEEARVDASASRQRAPCLHQTGRDLAQHGELAGCDTYGPDVSGAL